MARTTTERARRELTRQANEAFDAPAIVSPQAAQYGVFNTGYAGALAQRALDPYFGGANTIGLQLNAMGEDAQYARELEATRQAQLQAQNTAAYYGLLDKTMRDAGDVPIGTYGIGFDQNGRASVTTDPVFAAAQNALDLDTQASDIQGTRAEALSKMATAGYGFSNPDASAFIRNPLESPDTVPQLDRYFTPAAETARYSADEGMTVEQQFSMQELKNMGMLDVARERAAANDGKWKLVINPDDGTESYVFTGTNAELQGMGFNPPGAPQGQSDEARLRTLFPNAGANTPAAPATQGSVNNFYMRPSSPRGMRTHPITHDRRMHNGDDYAYPAGTPYPAEDNGTVVSVGNVRGFGPHTVIVEYDNGSEVLYGHGQASHVVPGQRVSRGQPLGLVGSEGRSTGPHVHREVRRPPTRQSRTPARQASNREAPTRVDRITAIMTRAQERGGTVTQQGENIVVTAPDGRTATYNANGDRIS